MGGINSKRGHMKYFRNFAGVFDCGYFAGGSHGSKAKRQSVSILIVIFFSLIIISSCSYITKLTGSLTYEKKSTPSPSKTEATCGVPPEEKHVKSEEGTHKPFVPNRKNIKTVQGLLLNAGYNPGPLDGLWGSKTGGAVRDFQKRSWSAFHRGDG